MFKNCHTKEEKNGYLRCWEDDHRLGDVYDHPDGGECGLKVLWVRRSDGDRHHADVETTVEGGYEVNARRVYQGYVVPGVEPTLLQQQARDLLSLEGQGVKKSMLSSCWY